jgi:hypothetical protein
MTAVVLLATACVATVTVSTVTVGQHGPALVGGERDFELSIGWRVTLHRGSVT